VNPAAPIGHPELGSISRTHVRTRPCPGSPHPAHFSVRPDRVPCGPAPGRPERTLTPTERPHAARLPEHGAPQKRSAPTSPCSACLGAYACGRGSPAPSDPCGSALEQRRGARRNRCRSTTRSTWATPRAGAENPRTRLVPGDSRVAPEERHMWNGAHQPGEPDDGTGPGCREDLGRILDSAVEKGPETFRFPVLF
jgi:hypothetical protein